MPDGPVTKAVVLAAVMTAAITVAVVLGQDDAIAAMVVAIVAVSVIGAAVFGPILSRTVIRVGSADDPGSGD